MSSIKANPIDKVSVYIAAGLVSGAGALLLNVLPLLFGALAEKFALGENQLGNLALAMNLGFGLLGLASLLWVRRVSWRVISALSSLLVIAMVLYVVLEPSFEALFLVMALAGAGTGALYALAMTIFGDSSQPERAFGFKLGIETVPGALLLVLLPVAVMPVWGFHGMLLTIALSMLLMGIVPLAWVPARSERPVQAAGFSAEAYALRRPIVWLSLLSSLVFLTGIMAVWAFLELIGKKTGLASETIGTVLAVGFIINAGGGFIASSIGLKAGRFLPVAAIVLAECVGLVMLGQFASLTSYVIGAVLFLFSISFVLAYTFGIMAEFDVSGKLVALGALCLSAGAAFGPAISGLLIERYGYSAALMFSAACSVLALAAYGAAVLRSQHILRREQPGEGAVLSRL
ncbi:MFS transporter [Pseudomonas cremoricolorata]|uniref:MFS transporter n=1 Tax=Pseudomonas cremoricolorata TaxID=157783 RepID=UPI0003F7444C|nr:MFS transporter [Pseudomonas cremoricolorata]